MLIKYQIQKLFDIYFQDGSYLAEFLLNKGYQVSVTMVIYLCDAVTMYFFGNYMYFNQYCMRDVVAICGHHAHVVIRPCCIIRD